MGETDLQLGGGYRYQWECAILLALNYFFDPVRYNPTLFDMIKDFLGGVTEIHLEGEDRENGVELEDVNLINGDRRILIQVKTKQAEGERWTLTDPLLLKALYRFYDSDFLTEQPDTTRFVFFTNRPFNPDLVELNAAIAKGELDQCSEADKLYKQLDRYISKKDKNREGKRKGKMRPIDAGRLREMLVRLALVDYLPVDAVKANVQAKLQAHWQKDRDQAFAVLYEHFSRQSTLIGGGVVTRESVVDLLGELQVKPDVITPRHNLPPRRLYVERGGYIDRVMEELSATQETVWIVGLCGPRGAGKTSLALEVAHRCLEQQRFEGIVWMTAEQEALTINGAVRGKSVLASLEDLYDEIAETLACDSTIKLESTEDKRDAIGKMLKERRCLLIVDSIASLGGEEVVLDLRDLVQPTKIIITTRHQLKALDRVHRLGSMDREPALKLMRAECEAKGVKASDEELTTLYNSTDGLPLAMVWCIGRMSELPVRRVLRQMRRVGSNLLQYCFANSLDELSPEANRILCAASLFATSASYDALFATSGIEALSSIYEDEDVFDDGLCQLTRFSLVNKEGDRYSLLSLTREFVLGEMESWGLDEIVGLRYAYANYFLHYAEEHNSRSGDDLKDLGVERKNIRKVVNWGTSQENEDLQGMLPRLADALYEFQWLRGYWNELVEYNKLAVEVSKKRGDWQQVGDHAYAIGFIRFQQGNYDEAGKWGQEAASAMARSADEFRQACAKRLLAMVARENGDYATSKHLLEEMLARGEELLKAARSDEEIRRIRDDILANALTSLANLERDLPKNYLEARRLYEESLATNRDLGNSEKIGLNLNHLGRVDLAEYEQARCAGCEDEAVCHLALAEEHFTGGRDASEDASRADQILIGMWGQARVAEERSEYVQARELAQEAIACYGFCGAAEVAEVQELLDRVERALQD